ALKGPSSILFGRGSTGGVINQVSKTPNLTRSYQGSVSLGTDLTKRATADLTQPLTDLAPGTALRLTAMGTDADVAGRDQAKNRRYGVAPS
ncbi:TonB-dependent siderophore receptor, partial [Acinetobacter baumannii]